jgi:hypothetical protein
MIRIGEWVRVNGKRIGKYNFVGLVVGRDGGMWLIFDRGHGEIITACEHLLTLAPAPPDMVGLPFAAMLALNPITAN